MTNDGAKQATVRAATGTVLDYNGDWSALFDQAGQAKGDWNGRMLAWLNTQLGAAYSNLPGALQAFAVSQGAPNWSQLGAFTIGGGGGTASLDFSVNTNSMYFVLGVV